MLFIHLSFNQLIVSLIFLKRYWHVVHVYRFPISSFKTSTPPPKKKTRTLTTLHLHETSRFSPIQRRRLAEVSYLGVVWTVYQPSGENPTGVLKKRQGQATIYASTFLQDHTAGTTWSSISFDTFLAYSSFLVFWFVDSSIVDAFSWTTWQLAARIYTNKGYKAPEFPRARPRKPSQLCG